VIERSQVRLPAGALWSSNYGQVVLTRVSLIGASGLVGETKSIALVSRYESRRRHLQATLSKLLTYCVLRPTQPPTLSGTGNE